MGATGPAAVPAGWPPSRSSTAWRMDCPSKRRNVWGKNQRFDSYAGERNPHPALPPEDSTWRFGDDGHRGRTPPPHRCRACGLGRTPRGRDGRPRRDPRTGQCWFAAAERRNAPAEVSAQERRAKGAGSDSGGEGQRDMPRKGGDELRYAAQAMARACAAAASLASSLVRCRQAPWPSLLGHWDGGRGKM